MRLPEFIIGGAPRSGTTWLWHLLDRHPGVVMAKPARPEPKFFLVDDVYAKGLGHYSRTWFEGIPMDRIAGEKSTNYLESAIACRRIAKDLPGIKLIFILRDPIGRAWSNWRWSTANGLESLDFMAAIAAERERESGLRPDLVYARPYSYVSRGMYADLLIPWLSEFPRKDIQVLAYEDIVHDPRSLATSVHVFLGAHERPADADGLGRINAAPDGLDTVPAEIHERMRERFVEPNQRLERLLGQRFPHWVGATP